MMSDEGQNPLVPSKKYPRRKLHKENLPNPERQDGNAVAEKTVLDLGTYEQQAHENNHKRQEKVRDSFAAAFVCGFWLLFGLACIAVIIWDWHLVCPKNWCWLDNGQLEKLAQIMQFAYGAFAGSVATYARQFIKSAPKTHALQ